MSTFVFKEINGDAYVIHADDYDKALHIFVEETGVLPYEHTEADGEGNIVIEGYHPDDGYYRIVKPDQEERERLIQEKRRMLEQLQAKQERQKEEIRRINEAYEKVKARTYEVTAAGKRNQEAKKFLVSLTEKQRLEMEEEEFRWKKQQIVIGINLVMLGVLSGLMGF